MKMKKLAGLSAALSMLTLSALSAAGDFDGSRKLICAGVEINSCSSGIACERGIPEEFGAPPFMRIDFAKKQIIGTKKITKIENQKSDKELDQLLLHGSELGSAWTIALDGDGKMTLTLVDRYNAYVIYGHCTPI